MSLVEYTLLALSSLIAIVDPIAVVPSFLAMTPTDSRVARIRMAKIACAVATGILLLFTLTGPALFKVLGVTLPAFQLAGSLLLMRIAFDMLYARRPGTQQTDEEVAEGTAKDDIAITPLGVPMLAGPGAISNVLILTSQAETWVHHVLLVGCILVIGGVSYLVLRLSAQGAQFLSPLILKLITRLMGLLLAAIAAQFALTALENSPLFGK